jgi:hypothetical protein
LDEFAMIQGSRGRRNVQTEARLQKIIDARLRIIHPVMLMWWGCHEFSAENRLGDHLRGADLFRSPYRSGGLIGEHFVGVFSRLR